MSERLKRRAFVNMARESRNVSELMTRAGLSRFACWNRLNRLKAQGVDGLNHLSARGPRIAVNKNQFTRAARKQKIMVDITDPNY